MAGIEVVFPSYVGNRFETKYDRFEATQYFFYEIIVLQMIITIQNPICHEITLLGTLKLRNSYTGKLNCEIILLTEGQQ